MWRNFRFLHIYNVEKFEMTAHVKKFQISPQFLHMAIFLQLYKAEIADKYDVWEWIKRD